MPFGVGCPHTVSWLHRLLRRPLLPLSHLSLTSSAKRFTHSVTTATQAKADLSSARKGVSGWGVIKAPYLGGRRSGGDQANLWVAPISCRPQSIRSLCLLPSTTSPFRKLLSGWNPICRKRMPWHKKTTRRWLFSFNHQRVDTLCPKGRALSSVPPACPQKNKGPPK